MNVNKSPDQGSFQKVFYIIEQLISNYLTGVLIIGLILSMCLEITLRWCFRESMVGLPETVEMFVVAATFTSLAIAQRTESHIKMDALLKKLEGRRSGNILKFINTIIVMALFVVLGIILCRYTIIAYQVGHVTMNIFLPRWPSYFFASLGSLIMLCRLAIQAKEQFKQIKNG